MTLKPPGTRVVVLPEGVAITFLAGCVNPLGVHTFFPYEFHGLYDDPSTARRLEEARPELVLTTTRPVEEYGARGLITRGGRAAWRAADAAGLRPAR